VKTSEIAPGATRRVVVDGNDVLLCNVGGEIYAVEDVCTHDGGILTGGVLEDDVVTCPRHGARFCVRTGKALSPPAYEDVPVFPVRITGAGVVQVRDSRWEDGGTDAVP